MSAKVRVELQCVGYPGRPGCGYIWVRPIRVFCEGDDPTPSEIAAARDEKQERVLCPACSKQRAADKHAQAFRKLMAQVVELRERQRRATEKRAAARRAMERES